MADYLRLLFKFTVPPVYLKFCPGSGPTSCEGAQFRRGYFRSGRLLLPPPPFPLFIFDNLHYANYKYGRLSGCDFNLPDDLIFAVLISF